MEPDDARERVEKQVRFLVPIAKGDAPERITYGVVLEPDSEDLQGDVMTAEDIEKAAYDWMERSQSGGHMHSKLVEGATVVESYLAPADISVETADGTETIKKGSWVLAMRWPPDIWESIQEGELTGYSVGGTGVRLAMEEVGKKGKWAPGPNAGFRLADGSAYQGDPAAEGAAAEGGGTPADRGAAAARGEGHKALAEGQRDYDRYVASGASRVTDLDDGPARRMEGLHGKPFTFAPRAEAFLLDGDMRQGEVTPVTMLRHGVAPLPDYESVANERYFVEVGFRDGSRGIVESHRLGVPENYHDAAPEYKEGLRRAGVGSVKKHGTHDQSTHGNWARGGGNAKVGQKVRFEDGTVARVTEIHEDGSIVVQSKDLPHSGEMVLKPGQIDEDGTVDLAPQTHPGPYDRPSAYGGRRSESEASAYRAGEIDAREGGLAGMSDEEIKARVKANSGSGRPISDAEAQAYIDGVHAVRAENTRVSAEAGRAQIASWGRKVRKHGSHDQSTHGNWARRGRLGDQQMREEYGDESPDLGVGSLVRIKDSPYKGKVLTVEYGTLGWPDEYDIMLDPEDVGWEDEPMFRRVTADQLELITDPDERYWMKDRFANAGVPAASESKKPVRKHGSHDQREHGNWARGRRKERDRRPDSAEDTYARETLRSVDLTDDIEGLLQDMPAPSDDFKPTWGDAGTAEEVDNELRDVLGFLYGDADAYAHTQPKPPKFKTAEDAYVARMTSAFGRLDELRNLLEDRPAPSDDFEPNWEHAGTAGEVTRRLVDLKGFLGGGDADPGPQTYFWSAKPKRGFKEPTRPTGGTYFWSQKRADPDGSAECLSDAVRKGLRDAVAKHGSHDQSTHGNWAQGRTARTDDDMRDGYPSGTVDDEEMYPTGGTWQGEEDVDLLDLFDDSRGTTVTLDGHDYTIKEIKPFKHVPGLDSVMLEPKDKNAEWYRAERAKLHDDWDLEVSDPERLVELAQQLPGWRSERQPLKWKGAGDRVFAGPFTIDLESGNYILTRRGRPSSQLFTSLEDAGKEAERQWRIKKHGSGDQSPHGNWAHGGGGRKHTTRDGVVIEDQPKVQHIKNSEAFASADGRVQLNYGEWKWLATGQSWGVAKPPKLHERGHWGAWPRGADRSDVGNVIWAKNQTLAEFINSLDPGEYDLAT